MTTKTKNWKTYEEVAKYLLNEIAAEFELEQFEGKQSIKGKRSQNSWEIDAKDISGNNETFFIVECRRNTSSRQSQEKLGGLTYRIIDSGAKGGIIVSPLELQKGAKLIAKAENIHHVMLNENCTTSEYILRFLNKLRVGKHLQSSVSPTGTVIGTIFRKGGTIEELGELNKSQKLD